MKTQTQNNALVATVEQPSKGLLEVLQDAVGIEYNTGGFELYLLAIIAFIKYGVPYLEKLVQYFFKLWGLQILSNWKKLDMLYALMRTIKQEYNFKQVCIFTVADSGGVPKAGNPVYVNFMHAVGDMPVGKIPLSNKAFLDYSYINLVSELMQKDSAIIRTKTLSKGLLKNHLSRARADTAVAYMLNKDRKRLNILLCTHAKPLFKKGKTDIELQEHARSLRMQVDKIRNALIQL